MVESYGISETPESGEDRLKREAQTCLLDKLKQKKQKGKDEVDYEDFEAQIREWKLEVEDEIRYKDTGKDVVFKRGW